MHNNIITYYVILFILRSYQLKMIAVYNTAIHLEERGSHCLSYIFTFIYHGLIYFAIRVININS